MSHYALYLGLTLGGMQGGHWCAFALALMVGFHGLLRPIELQNLRRSDVKLPSDWGSGSTERSALFALRWPKNWRYMGRQQLSHLNDCSVVAWLEWFCRSLAPTCLLFPSLFRMRAMLRQVLNFFGLASSGISLASLRAGGATFLFTRDHNLGTLQFLGRWSCAKSLQHYVQESMSMLVQFSVSSVIQILLDYVVSNMSFLQRPPPQTWDYFLGIASMTPLLFSEQI